MRYHRQELVIGKKAQNKLRNASVCIVGAGALGSISAELLARAGVGKLRIIDKDVVELSNLQRQSMYTEDDIGQFKADAAKNHLLQINSDVSVGKKVVELNHKNVNLIKADVVLDCTDNLETKFLINDYCIKNKIPLVHGSAVKTAGFVFVINDGACLRCFLDKKQPYGTCADVGVLNVLTHMIASMQATQALKLIIGEKYEKNLIRIDPWNSRFEIIKVKKNSKCPMHRK